MKANALARAGALLLLITTAMLTPAKAQQEAPPTAPLVFIPGLMGTKLCEPGPGGKAVWSDTLELEAGLWDLADQEAFTDEVTRTIIKKLKQREGADFVHKPCGIMREDAVTASIAVEILFGAGITRTVDAGLVSSGYGQLISFLEGLGYSEQAGAADQQLHVFPYDWRLSNLENARRLGAFIEALDHEGPVDLLAHSMGGLIAHAYLAQNRGSHSVRKFISMGTPYLGAAAPLLYAQGVEGEQEGILAKAPYELIFLWPSILELMPRYDRCCVILGQGDEENRNFKPMDEGYFEKLPWFQDRLGARGSFNADDVSKALGQWRALDEILARPLTDVDRYWVASFAHPTSRLIRLSSDMTTIDSIVSGLGDDTVPDESATFQVPGPDDVLEADDVHMRIFARAKAQNNLRFALLEAGEQQRVDRHVTVDITDFLPRRLRLAGSVSAEVEIISIGLKVDDLVWDAGRGASARVHFTYEIKLSERIERFIKDNDPRIRRVINAVKARIGDRLEGDKARICVELPDDPICLELSDIEHGETEDGIRTLSATFGGNAPLRPGAYRLSVEQDLIDVGLSRPILVLNIREETEDGE